MLKITKKYVSLFAKCNRNKQKTLKFFHLTQVTQGGEAKMESGHTFLRFVLTLP